MPFGDHREDDVSNPTLLDPQTRKVSRRYSCCLSAPSLFVALRFNRSRHAAKIENISVQLPSTSENESLVSPTGAAARATAAVVDNTTLAPTLAGKYSPGENCREGITALTRAKPGTMNAINRPGATRTIWGATNSDIATLRTPTAHDTTRRK